MSSMSFICTGTLIKFINKSRHLPKTQMEQKAESHNLYFWVYSFLLLLHNKGSNFRIPGHFIYMCRWALKNEVYNNSCYSYSMRC